MSTAPAIELEALCLGWRGRPVVQGVSGRFEAGSMTAIVGPNGAGKSTLVKGIMGVLRPLAGRVRMTGGGRSGLAWLPQATDLDRAFPITVFDMVALGAWRRVGPWRHYGVEEMARTRAALETVGVADLADRAVGTLSGGQLQRALFARMLVQDAPVLLLDEPFSAVDGHTADALMTLLRTLHAQGRTVVAVLHDLELVRAHFPHALMLSGHMVAWGQTNQVLSGANLAAARRWHAERGL